MYHFPDQLNQEGFCRIDKKWVENMHLAILPDSSKAILPVILSYCNTNGISFPSYPTIAALTGLTTRTVQGAVKGLRGFPGIEIQDYITKRGRIGKKYILNPRQDMSDEKGQCFFFHRAILEYGNWRMLEKNISVGLYLAMRHFAYFDFETYLLVEGEQNASLYDLEVPELYKIRRWDICESEIAVLAKFAGISRPSVYEGLKDLQKNFLIEEMLLDEDGVRHWKVFLIPPKYYKRDFLNGQLKGTCKNSSTMCKKSSSTRVKILPKRVKKTSGNKGGSC